jgi:hypothetical protein
MIIPGSLLNRLKSLHAVSIGHSQIKRPFQAIGGFESMRLKKN